MELTETQIEKIIVNGELYCEKEETSFSVKCKILIDEDTDKYCIVAFEKGVVSYMIDITKKWTGKSWDWGQTLDQLCIYFGD